MLKNRSAIQAGLLLCMVLVPLLTTSCGTTQVPQVTAPTQLLSQKVTPEGRIPVTVLVKHAFSINTFETIVEERFPQLDLIQVGNYTSDRGLVEYARRLEHDDLTDVVMTWPLNVGEAYWSDRLMDLSAMRFTENYHVSMLNSISKDGKLYYLPGPAQVRGIVYNKTMFAEHGWQVPNDFDGFVALCQKIEASGIRSLQLGLGNGEVLDTALVGYSFGDCFNKPKDSQWLADYNTGRGSATHLLPALETFQQMADAGIWNKNDLLLTYSDREKMLFSRQCAMIEDSVLMARMGNTQTGTTDEFALMPFFSPQDHSDWARLYMVCYIGVNQTLARPENEEKYQLVMELLEYISTPEGQQALSADNGAMYSSVKGVPPPNIPEIQALIPALEAGRYAIFPELTNVQQTLRTGLASLLMGTTTPQQLIALLDMENSKPVPPAAASAVLGAASTSFTLIQTGSFIADTMSRYANTQIALCMDNGMDGRANGKGVSGKIYQGEQTQADVLRVTPDLKSGDAGQLQVVTMTGAHLLQTLEYSIPVENNSTGWFYYFSGLQMTFDPTAQPGSRIHAITTTDGQAIDPQAAYTIAIMAGTVPEAYVITSTDFSISIAQLLAQAISTQGTIAPPTDNRFLLP